MSRIVHGIIYSHRVVHKFKSKTGYALGGVRGEWGDYTFVVWDSCVEPEIVPWECIEKFVEVVLSLETDEYTEKFSDWSSELIGQKVKHSRMGCTGIVEGWKEVRADTVAMVRVGILVRWDESLWCKGGIYLLEELRFKKPLRQDVVKVLNEVSVTLDIPTEIEYGGRVYVLKEDLC